MKEFYYEVNNFEEFKIILERHPTEGWTTGDWLGIADGRKRLVRTANNRIIGWNNWNDDLYLRWGLKKMPVYDLKDYIV